MLTIIRPEGGVMLTRFMDGLELAPDGRSLEVCGPITWEPGDLRADFRFILRQGATMVAGLASAQAPADDEWEQEKVKVPSPKTFEPGVAVGLAVALLHRQGGEVVPIHWTQEVTLKEA
jgi:hypothetical protein